MATHAKGWDLKQSAVESCGSWLEECIGSNFDMDKYLSAVAHASGTDSATGAGSYSMSLAQQCEYAWYQKLLKSLSDNDRKRLLSNSGPTQTWVTALPLLCKNWNLS